eukprot:scaffold324724_cov38-Prasinocladus_malaysianus.AAC.1
MSTRTGTRTRVLVGQTVVWGPPPAGPGHPCHKINHAAREEFWKFGMAGGGPTGSGPRTAFRS